MNRNNYTKDYEMLEIDFHASYVEIKQAYINLKQLYSGESIVTIPLMDEFIDGEKENILKNLEDAFLRLSALLGEKDHAPKEKDSAAPTLDEDLKKHVSNINVFNGSALKELREKMGIDLHDIAKKTKISKDYLDNIETECFQHLPHKIYVRAYVSAYGEYLSLDNRKVIKDYMKCYSDWEKAEGMLDNTAPPIVEVQFLS